MFATTQFSILCLVACYLEACRLKHNMRDSSFLQRCWWRFRSSE